jgi:hypothetical protein
MKKKALKKPSEFFSAKTDKVARKIGAAIVVVGTTMTTTLAMIDGVEKKWPILAGSLTGMGSVMTMWFKQEEEDE